MKRSTLPLIRIVGVVVFFTIMLSLVSTAYAFDKVNYANADPLKYRIELDLTNNITTIYERDDKGGYSKIAKQFICTPGAASTPTPMGSFRLNDSRRRFGYFSKFGVYAQYWTNVSGGIYFHSILYTRQKEGYFTSSSYNRLGSTGSHGCIRLLVEDARWLYYNCPSGTYGEIVKKEKNSELRKSLLPKVSARNYSPEPDQYENTPRSAPMALLKSDATFTDTNKNQYVVKKDTPVTLISMGSISCRVHVAGIEGHIDTQNLNFLPNGPEDQEALKKINTKASGYYTIYSKTAAFYSKASPAASIIKNYAKGTQMKFLGSTENFIQAEIEGKVGFVLKKDLTYQFAPMSDKLTAIPVEDSKTQTKTASTASSSKQDDKPKATAEPTQKPDDSDAGAENNAG